MKADRTYWFGKKRIGWGMGPRSWQGWVTILVYTALMIALSQLIDPESHYGLALASKIGITALLFVVFAIKGDWRRSQA